MRSKVLIIAVAALMVGGGALVAVAQTEDDTAEPDRSPGILEEVLDDLVDDGTLTDSQADAVQDALVERREELREERRQRVAELRERGRQLREFLEDDVIDAEELEQLPEDGFLRDPDGPLGDALEDGEITREELSDLGGFVRGYRRGFHDWPHFGGHPGFDAEPQGEGTGV